MIILQKEKKKDHLLLQSVKKKSHLLQIILYLLVLIPHDPTWPAHDLQWFDYGQTKA